MPGNDALSDAELSEIYRAYIGCLNRQDWCDLDRFVDDTVEHNGRPFGLAGYREMLVKDFQNIPDLHFQIDFLVTSTPHVAARLLFDCSPKDGFLGLKIGGRKVSFTENVFYEFRGMKIISVWSIVDKSAIEEQIEG